MTNCINCGAPLHGNKCEYCGTEYNNRTITGNIPKIGNMCILKVGNEEIKVYIESIEVNERNIEAYRDGIGIIHVSGTTSQRKFTLIEV